MEFTEFQHMTHLIGTSVLILLYLLRLVVLFRRRSPVDRSPGPEGSLARGVMQSLLTIIMPWKMESTRRHWTRYAEFAAFHLGVFSNIFLSFAITYVPQWFIAPVRYAFVGLIALGLVAGMIRFLRRLAVEQMRVISSPDDYFSMMLVLLFLITGIFTLLEFQWALVFYFALAALFLVYEPFSKIRHYIYYPFTRYYLGAQLARKGILGREG